MKILRSLVLNLLVALVSIGVVFGTTEWAFRTFSGDRVHTFFDEQTERALGKPIPKKAPDEYRIFIFGGSAAYGFPVTDRYSISSWLDKSFKHLLPDKKVRIINCGWVGKASHHLLEGSRYVLKYEPDLYIIYSGSNEAFLANRLFTDNALYRLNLKLHFRSVFYRWLWSRLHRLRKKIVYGKSGYPERQYREETIAQKVYRQGEVTSEELDGILKRFRMNTEEIVRTAHRNGVDVLLTNVPSNLRDIPPSSSIHRKPLTPEELDQWNRLFERGKALQKSGKYKKALQAYLEAGTIDPTHADLQFRLGKCYDHLKNYGAAKEAYLQAIDFEGYPHRAPSGINEAIREIAAKQSAIFVDIIGAFEKRSAQGIVSSDLVFDDVHPSITGQQVIADEILKALARENKIAPGPEWNWKALETARQNQASDVWQVDGTLNAYRYILQGLISWEQKRYSDAVREFEKGLELMPNFIESYAFLGDSYLRLGKPEKALSIFKTLQAKDPSIFETLLRKYPDVQHGYTQSLTQAKR